MVGREEKRENESAQKLKKGNIRARERDCVRVLHRVVLFMTIVVLKNLVVILRNIRLKNFKSIIEIYECVCGRKYKSKMMEGTTCSAPIMSIDRFKISVCVGTCLNGDVSR